MKNLTVNEIKNNSNYRYHHTGSRRGYESRKGSGHVESYNGRFGKGYVVISPRWDTTQYVDVHYYIEKECMEKEKGYYEVFPR